MSQRFPSDSQNIYKAFALIYRIQQAGASLFRKARIGSVDYLGIGRESLKNRAPNP